MIGNGPHVGGLFVLCNPFFLKNLSFFLDRTVRSETCVEHNVGVIVCTKFKGNNADCIDYLNAAKGAFVFISMNI